MVDQEVPPTEDDVTISLHHTSNTMQLHVTINGEFMLALVDSGSAHTFVTEGNVHRLGLPCCHAQA